MTGRRVVDMPTKQPRRYSSTGLFPQSIEKLLQSVTERAVKKKGFHTARLLTHWQEIAGPEIAPYCTPQSLKIPRGKAAGGTLTLKVKSGFALQIQHQQAQLLQRVNDYFGSPVAHRVKIMQTL
jgi:hypothetical protein